MLNEYSHVRFVMSSAGVIPLACDELFFEEYVAIGDNVEDIVRKLRDWDIDIIRHEISKNSTNSFDIELQLKTSVIHTNWM